MGLAVLKTRILNLSRPGLMLYGLYPSLNLKKKIKLSPVMSVKSRIIFIKRVAKGFGISYGHIFVAKKNMTVATLPIGYNDGYFRCLSNKAYVIVAGKKCPVVGRVTMDQIMVDMGDFKVKIGDRAVLIGGEKKQCISAEELAMLSATIPYEIVCGIGSRVPRLYIN